MFKNVFLFLLIGVTTSFAQMGSIQGHSFLGGTQASTSGLKSTNYLDGIIPNATITVYLTGTTTLATIYANGSGTPLANPFTSNASSSLNPGGWIFWAATNAGVDVIASGGITPNTYPAPVPLCIGCFPAGGGGSGSGCVSTGAAGTFNVSNGSGGCEAIPADYGYTYPASFTFTGTDTSGGNAAADFNINLTEGGTAGYSAGIYAVLSDNGANNYGAQVNFEQDSGGTYGAGFETVLTGGAAHSANWELDTSPNSIYGGGTGSYSDNMNANLSNDYGGQYNANFNFDSSCGNGGQYSCNFAFDTNSSSAVTNASNFDIELSGGNTSSGIAEISASGGISLDSNNGISLNDDSATGIAINEGSTGSITIAGNTIHLDTLAPADLLANGSQICTTATGCSGGSPSSPFASTQYSNSSSFAGAEPTDAALYPGALPGNKIDAACAAFSGTNGETILPPDMGAGDSVLGLPSGCHIIDYRATGCMDYWGTYSFSLDSPCYYSVESSQDNISATTDKANVQFGYASNNGGVYSFNGSSGTKSNRFGIMEDLSFRTPSQKWGIYQVASDYTGGEFNGFATGANLYGGYLGNGQEASNGFRAEYSSGPENDTNGGVAAMTVTEITGNVVSYMPLTGNCTTANTNKAACSIGATRIIRDLTTPYSTGSIASVSCTGAGPTTCTVTGSGTLWTSITGFVGTHTTWNGLSTGGPILTNNLTLCFTPNAFNGHDWCVPITQGLTDTTLTVNLYDVGSSQNTNWWGPTTGTYSIYHSAWPTATDTIANTFTAGDVSGIGNGHSIDQVLAYNQNMEGVSIILHRDLGMPYGRSHGVNIENTEASGAPYLGSGVNVGGGFLAGLEVGSTSSGIPASAVQIDARGTNAIIQDVSPATTTPWILYRYARSDGAQEEPIWFDPNVASTTEGMNLGAPSIDLPGAINIPTTGGVNIPLVNGNTQIGQIYNIFSGVLGQYSNSLEYSDVTSGSIGTVWNQQCSGEPVTITYGVADPVGGNNAITLGIPNPSGCPGQYSSLYQSLNSSSLTPGNVYTISAFIEGTAGGENAVLGVYSDLGSISQVCTNSSALTTKWTRYQCTFVMPSGTTYIHAGIGGRVSSQNINFFRMQLEQASTAGYPIQTLASAFSPTSGVLAQNVIDTALTPGNSAICPNGPNGAFTNSGCASSSSVSSINGTPGAFTFSFSSGAGSCSGTTCTFTGSGGGSGSVTNFIANSASWPSWLVPTVTLSTSTPTLAVATPSQSGNTFLAAPNGSSGAPSFRTLVSADVPTLNQNTTGQSGTALALASAPSTCTAPQFAEGVGANGNAICATPGVGSGVTARSISGTTDHITAAYSNFITNYTSSSAVAVAIDAPASLGTGFFTVVQQQGAGVLTITPASGNINGGATAQTAQGQSCSIYIDSTGSNLAMSCNSGIITATNGLTTTPSSTGVQINGPAFPKTISNSTSTPVTGFTSETFLCGLTIPASTLSSTQDSVGSHFHFHANINTSGTGNFTVTGGLTASSGGLPGHTLNSSTAETAGRNYILDLYCNVRGSSSEICDGSISSTTNLTVTGSTSYSLAVGSAIYIDTSAIQTVSTDTTTCNEMQVTIY